MKSFPRLAATGTVILMTATLIASDRKVAMKDLPGPVQEAVREHTKGLTVIGLAEETEDGKTLYEVETKMNGKTRDILFDASGKLVADEKEVTVDSIPEHARAALGHAAAGGTITKVEAITKNGTTVYEAEIKKGGKKSEVVVGADGTVQKQ